MRGYPKYVATRQDYEHLLADDAYRATALEDLRSIRLADDETATRVVSGSEAAGDLVTEQISNPMPLWRVKGFASRQEVADLMAAYEEG